MDRELSMWDKKKQQEQPNPMEKTGIVGDYSAEAIRERINQLNEGTREQLSLLLEHSGLGVEIFDSWSSNVADEEGRKLAASLLGDFRMVTDTAERKKIAQELSALIKR